LLNPNIVTKLLHHPPILRERSLKSKTTFVVKKQSASAGATRNYTLDSEPESEEALPEAGTCTREDQDFFSVQYH